MFGKNVILTLTCFSYGPVETEYRLKALNESLMKRVKKSTVLHLIIELAAYAVLVSAYLALVLHFLVDWLKVLFTKQPEVYAYVSILLMIGQAVGLERLTSGLVYLSRRRKG